MPTRFKSQDDRPLIIEGLLRNRSLYVYTACDSEFTRLTVVHDVHRWQIIIKGWWVENPAHNLGVSTLQTLSRDTRGINSSATKTRRFNSPP